MSEGAKKTNKQKLIDSLQMQDTKKVLSTLESLKEKGTPDFILPLMNLAKDTADDEVKSKVITLLSELKSSAAITILLDSFHEKEFAPIHELLLSAIWVGNYQAQNHIENIVSTALGSNYMAAFECATILGNIEGTFPEDQLLESQINCRKFLEANPEAEQKILVEEILEKLEVMDTQQ